MFAELTKGMMVYFAGVQRCGRDEEVVSAAAEDSLAVAAGSEHVRGLLRRCLVFGSKRRWAAPVCLPNLQEEIIPSIVAICFVLSLFIFLCPRV
jgi:hypothetical protein